MNTLTPTHVITIEYADGRTTYTSVRLCDDGCAYDAHEYAHRQTADWTYNETDGWLCLGQVVPGGANGTVTVLRVGT